MVVKYLLFFVVLAVANNAVSSADLSNSEISIVNDDTRYLALNPGANLVPFTKVHHVKGNYVFTAGERISGDRLILNFPDDNQFTKSEDIEVFLKYPASGQNGATITCVEVYVDLTSEDADAFFAAGGIDNTYAEILLTCNQTFHYKYEISIFGY